MSLEETSWPREALGEPTAAGRPPIAPVGPEGAYWPMDGLAEDMRPFMAGCVDSGEAFALVTLYAADGGPRPVGTQMLVTPRRAWSFVSGGCVESDVTLHARNALRDGAPRTLVYGRGSPFVDIRLPCGGRIEVLVEPIQPSDPAVAELLMAWRERRSLRYLSDGQRRRCMWNAEEATSGWMVNRLHRPSQRLIVIGGDPFALAIAAEGRQQDWNVTIVRPDGPKAPPPLDVTYRRDSPDRALRALAPDEWTAIVVTSHDVEFEEAALAAGLRSAASYVGVLGSRRRRAERLGRLREAGLTEPELGRLRSPIGLPSAGRSPREIAIGVIAEIGSLSC